MSSAWPQATCDQGLSREIPNTVTPASSNSRFLSRRNENSCVQVVDQS
jgi:hypothetical protein